MPTGVHRHGRPSRGGGSDILSKILSGLVVVGILGFALYRNSVSTPSTWEEDAAPQQDSLSPPGYSIKGNISVTSRARLYHVPGMQDYETTVVDTRRGERWFRTEAEAVANGWRKAGEHKKAGGIMPPKVRSLRSRHFLVETRDTTLETSPPNPR